MMSYQREMVVEDDFYEALLKILPIDELWSLICDFTYWKPMDLIISAIEYSMRKTIRYTSSEHGNEPPFYCYWSPPVRMSIADINLGVRAIYSVWSIGGWIPTDKKYLKAKGWHHLCHWRHARWLYCENRFSRN